MAQYMCSSQKRRYYKLLSRGYSTDEAYEMSADSEKDLDKLVEMRRPRRNGFLEKNRRFAIAKPRREKVKVLRPGKPKEKVSSILVKSEPGSSSTKKKCVTFLLPTKKGQSPTNSKIMRTKLMSGSRRKRYKWFVTHGYSPEVAFVLSANTLNFPKSENDIELCKKEVIADEDSCCELNTVKNNGSPKNIEDRNGPISQFNDGINQKDPDCRTAKEENVESAKLPTNAFESDESDQSSYLPALSVVETHEEEMDTSQIQNDLKTPETKKYSAGLTNSEESGTSAKSVSDLPLGIVKCIKWLVSTGYGEEDVIALYFNMALKRAISSQTITIGNELCFGLQIAESGMESTVLEIIGSDLDVEHDSTNSDISSCNNGARTLSGDEINSSSALISQKTPEMKINEESPLNNEPSKCNKELSEMGSGSKIKTAEKSTHSNESEVSIINVPSNSASILPKELQMEIATELTNCSEKYSNSTFTLSKELDMDTAVELTYNNGSSNIVIESSSSVLISSEELPMDTTDELPCNNKREDNTATSFNSASRPSKESEMDTNEDQTCNNEPDDNNKKPSDPNRSIGSCCARASNQVYSEAKYSSFGNTNSSDGNGDALAEPEIKQIIPHFTGKIIRVGILHAAFPHSALSKDELCILEFFILKEVLKSAAIKPRFRGITHMEGYLLLSCYNKETAEWLWVNVPSWKPWHGAALKIVKEEALPHGKGVLEDRRGIFESTNKICDYLKAQNPTDLNIDSWVFYDRKDFDSSVQLTFGIESGVADRLTTGRESLCYKFNQIPFRVDDLEESEIKNRFDPRSATNLMPKEK